MQIVFSEELDKILAYARDEAMRTGSMAILPDHLALGLLRHSENDACEALDISGVSREELKHFIESQLYRKDAISYSEAELVNFSRASRDVLNIAILEASAAGRDKADSSHLLMAIARHGESLASGFLRQAGVDRDRIADALKTVWERKESERRDRFRKAVSDKFFELYQQNDKIYS